MRKVLITGGAGQLASDLVRAFGGWQVHAIPHDRLDVADERAVGDALRSLRPDVLINTAAFHRVDDCEVDVHKAFAVNTDAVNYLARACHTSRTVLVHISTDYVFRGDSQVPYLEGDPPGPVNIYGLSKLAGERVIRGQRGEHLIVRTSGLFGAAGVSGNGGNFANFVLARARSGERTVVVDDQRLAPTYTLHAAQKIAWLVQAGARGICHLTNSESCTWFEFAREIIAASGLRADIRPTTTAQFGARARRPAYSVLAHGALEAAAADDMPPWREGLRQYLAQIGVVAGKATVATTVGAG